MSENILTKIYDFLARKTPSNAPLDTRVRQVVDFMNKNEINFNGYGGLNIHRQVVREYGYLLRYVTEGKLDTFEDFQGIRDHQAAIVENIDRELAKPMLRESEVFGYSRQTAEGNLLRMKALVETIALYTALCETLGIDIYAPRAAGL